MRGAMLRTAMILGGLTAALLVACDLASVADERNPFLQQAETFGDFDTGDDDGGDGGDDGTVGGFRRAMTVTLQANNNFGDVDLDGVDLSTAFAAWVNTSSIRNADQQDALLADGYVQLTRTVQIGSVFTLPPGTFVYNGPGLAGSTLVSLQTPRADATTTPRPSSVTFDLITPDVILVFHEPPVSCDGIAFEWTLDGEPLGALLINDESPIAPTVTAGATEEQGGRKTYSQVSAYQCDPFEPGLFLKVGGGGVAANEFLEGQAVQFTFDTIPDADGNYCVITLTGP